MSAVMNAVKTAAPLMWGSVATAVCMVQFLWMSAKPPMHPGEPAGPPEGGPGRDNPTPPSGSGAEDFGWAKFIEQLTALELPELRSLLFCLLAAVVLVSLSIDYWHAHNTKKHEHTEVPAPPVVAPPAFPASRHVVKTLEYARPHAPDFSFTGSDHESYLRDYVRFQECLTSYQSKGLLEQAWENLCKAEAAQKLCALASSTLRGIRERLTLAPVTERTPAFFKEKLEQFICTLAQCAGLSGPVVVALYKRQYYALRCGGSQSSDVLAFCVSIRNAFSLLMAARKRHSAGETFTPGQSVGSSQELREMINHARLKASSQIPSEYQNAFDRYLIQLPQGVSAVSLDAVITFFQNMAGVEFENETANTVRGGFTMNSIEMNGPSDFSAENGGGGGAASFEAAVFPDDEVTRECDLICEEIAAHPFNAAALFQNRYAFCKNPNHLRGTHCLAIDQADWSKPAQKCPKAARRGQMHPVNASGKILCPEAFREQHKMAPPKNSANRCDMLIDVNTGRPETPLWDSQQWKEGRAKDMELLSKERKWPKASYINLNEKNRQRKLTGQKPIEVTASAVRKDGGKKGKGKGKGKSGAKSREKEKGKGPKDGKGQPAKTLNNVQSEMWSATEECTFNAVTPAASQQWFWAYLLALLCAPITAEIEQFIRVLNFVCSWLYPRIWVMSVFVLASMAMDVTGSTSVGVGVLVTGVLVWEVQQRVVCARGSPRVPRDSTIVQMINTVGGNVGRRRAIYIQGYLKALCGERLSIPIYLDPGAWVGGNFLNLASYERMRAEFGEDVTSAPFEVPNPPCVQFGRSCNKMTLHRAVKVKLQVVATSGDSIDLTLSCFLVKDLNTPGLMLGGETTVYDLGVSYGSVKSEGVAAFASASGVERKVKIVPYDDEGKAVLNAISERTRLLAFGSAMVMLTLPPTSHEVKQAVFQPSVVAKRDGISFLPTLVKLDPEQQTTHQLSIQNNRPKDRAFVATRDHFVIQPLASKEVIAPDLVTSEEVNPVNATNATTSFRQRMLSALKGTFSRRGSPPSRKSVSEDGDWELRECADPRPRNAFLDFAV
eukprot:g16546.t1